MSAPGGGPLPAPGGTPTPGSAPSPPPVPSLPPVPGAGDLNARTSDRSGAGAGGNGGSGGGGGGKPDPKDKPTAPEAKRNDAAAGPTSAGTFGQGSEEHERLRRAENSFGGDQVFGDQVNGDKLLVHLYGTNRPVEPRELSDEVKDPVKRTFVAPHGWDELRVRSQRHCVLILRAAPGQGRTACALRLLDSRHHAQVFELDPNVDLDRLVDALAERAHATSGPGAAPGYVLANPTDNTRLSARMVRGLDAVLRRTGASLLLTLGSEANLEQDLMEFVVELPPAPARIDILRAHLRWRLPLVADQLLGRDDITEFLADVLGPTTTCSDVANLATILWEELDDAADELERVRARYAVRRDNEVDTWFSGLPDLPAQAFAIALAVCNGRPYEEVSRAARALLVRLERHAHPLSSTSAAFASPSDSRRHDPFGVPRQARLERLQAQVDDRRPTGLHRPAPSQNVSYRDNGRAAQVLLRAWTDYEIQDELLDWLFALIDHPSSRDMLVQVSYALGFLATKSFAYLQMSFLNTWALSDEILRQDVVAYALRAAALDPYVHPRVERFTTALFRNATSWQAQSTAARIYGVALGRLEPADALAKLERLALANDLDAEHGLDVGVAISRSFVDLILDRSDLYRPVLDDLLRWIEDDRRRDLAHLVFLILAARIVLYVPRGRGGEAAGPEQVVGWPALLRVAQTDPQVREPLLVLWRETLSHPVLQPATAGVIRDWAQAAEDDDEIRSAFSRFVRQLAEGDAGTASVLLGHADDWSDPDELFPLPLAAAAIRRVLRPASDLASDRLPVTTTMPLYVI